MSTEEGRGSKKVKILSTEFVNNPSSDIFEINETIQHYKQQEPYEYSISKNNGLIILLAQNEFIFHAKRWGVKIFLKIAYG